MLNNLNILFAIMLIMSSLMSISSSNWMGVWIGMELNMLSFIPIIISLKSIHSNKASLNYFLVQASSSSIFIFIAVFNCMETSLFFHLPLEWIHSILISIPLLIKLGAAPFHNWFVLVMQDLTWVKCFLLMSWQKITPLFILYYLNNNNKFILFFASLSLIMGSILGLNQTCLRKIMSFSSINHLGWMLCSMTVSKTLMLTYFSFYMMLTSFVVYFFNSKNIYQFNQTFLYNKFNFIILILSLGGLPPLLGFLPKWIIVQNLITENNLFMTLLLIMTSLITLFFYLRLIYSSTLLSSSTPKFYLQTNKKNLLINSFSCFISMTGLFFFNLI